MDYAQNVSSPYRVISSSEKEFPVNVSEEIVELRKWLQSDESRLRGLPVNHPEEAASELRASAPSNFNQHSNWSDQPGWKDWKKFANA